MLLSRGAGHARAVGTFRGPHAPPSRCPPRPRAVSVPAMPAGMAPSRRAEISCPHQTPSKWQIYEENKHDEVTLFGVVSYTATDNWNSTWCEISLMIFFSFVDFFFLIWGTIIQFKDKPKYLTGTTNLARQLWLDADLVKVSECVLASEKVALPGEAENNIYF